MVSMSIGNCCTVKIDLIHDSAHSDDDVAAAAVAVVVDMAADEDVALHVDSCDGGSQVDSPVAWLMNSPSRQAEPTMLMKYGMPLRGSIDLDQFRGI